MEKCLCGSVAVEVPTQSTKSRSRRIERLFLGAKSVPTSRERYITAKLSPCRQVLLSACSTSSNREFSRRGDPTDSTHQARIEIAPSGAFGSRLSPKSSRTASGSDAGFAVEPFDGGAAGLTLQTLDRGNLL
jgi:hypothetical protein